MLQENIINNVNVDSLPDNVKGSIVVSFNQLPLVERLVIYSRLIHGNLFKSERLELFKINKLSIAKIYENFIDDIKENL
jgi:hypothetical protein